jgi:uncharacterized cupin superfamily protein
MTDREDGTAATAPMAVLADEVPPRRKPSNYPEPFFSMMAGRVKQPLGDLFGLANFGVNLTRLPPGQASALHHRHSRQDEFIYVLAGTPTLRTEAGEMVLSPGMCAGFPAGGTAHHLVNLGTVEAVILEVGDRNPGDDVSYPNDDLQAVLMPDGKWNFTHKDGCDYAKNIPVATG